MKAILTKDGKFRMIEKDGHTDGASAINACKTIMSHCQMILDNVDPEQSLPTWWTNKLAISEYEVVSAANYLSNGLEGDG
ncbi:MAG: hypothetical protein RLZZ337_1641 [Bacteroidota bacterium]|jgi:hypothetical protein